MTTKSRKERHVVRVPEPELLEWLAERRSNAPTTDPFVYSDPASTPKKFDPDHSAIAGMSVSSLGEITFVLVELKPPKHLNVVK